MEAVEDTSVGDLVIPKGTSVAALLRPAALDQKNFVDPLAVRPERWLGSFTGPHEVSAHLPFGSGPRMCPDRSLALVEIKSLLSMLYKNFDVERVGDSRDVTELLGFTSRQQACACACILGQDIDSSGANSGSAGARFDRGPRRPTGRPQDACAMTCRLLESAETLRGRRGSPEATKRSISFRFTS
jgi:hypothetical protein